MVTVRAVDGTLGTRYRRTMSVLDPDVRVVTSDELGPHQLVAIRRLLSDAFADDGEGFTDEDWRHATGGVHFLLEQAHAVVAHAAVVERELHIDGRPLRTGYVEAVATRRDVQRRGLGTRLMEVVTADIRSRFELGALSTGAAGFYARLGWETWQGPSAVRTGDALRRTPDDDGSVMVLRTPSTPSIDLAGTISCPWRAGDVW